MLALATLLSSLSLASVGCGASDADSDAVAGNSALAATAKDVRASRSPEHAMLPGVWAIKSVGSENATLRIYETGGGDPAMNGNMLWLGASGDPSSDAGSMFDLGINILSVETVEETTPGTIRIVGTQNGMDSNDEITTKPYEAAIRYTLAAGAIVPKVRVTTPGGAEEVVASKEAGTDFLLGVFSARVTEAGESGHIARVYEHAAGDPAMNGVSVMLNLMNFPEDKTYDLGLNIAGVTKVEFKTGFEVRIDGNEDTMDASGKIVPRPVAFSVVFTVGDDGLPGEVIKLTKL